MGNCRTTFLFAGSSWVNGAARVLDMSGRFDDYNRLGTGEQADIAMLALDWLAVGDDLREAIRCEVEGLSADDLPRAVAAK